MKLKTRHKSETMHEADARQTVTKVKAPEHSGAFQYIMLCLL